MNFLYIIYPKQLTKRATLLAVLVFLAFLLGSLTHKALAYNTGNPAIGNNSPQANAANITGKTANVKPWMAVGTGAFQGMDSYAKVYVPVGTGATLTIHNGAGYCKDSSGAINSLDVYSAGYGYPNVWYEIWNMTDHEDFNDANTWPVGGQNTPSVAAGTRVKSLAGGTSCGDLTLRFPPGIASVYQGHQGYKVYYFEAHMKNVSCASPGVCDTEKNYQLSINNGGLVGYSRHVRSYPHNEFAIYLRNAPDITNGGNNWDFATQFAPRCNEDPSGQRSVNVYDIDWAVPGFYQPNLTGQIRQDDRANTSYSWSVAPPGRPTSQKIKNDWIAGSNKDDNLTFNINGNTKRYLLEFKDISYKNTIQIELPYDEIDAWLQVKCNPAARCTVSPPGTQTIVLGGTASVTVTGTMASGPWPSTYYIERSNTPFAGYKPITSPGISSGPDSLSPPYTYTYNYFVASSNPLETVNNRAGGPVINGTNCQATVTVTVPPPTAQATPYFQVWQNDAAAGGTFMTGDSCDTSSYPVYVSPGTAKTIGLSHYNYYGGIRGRNDIGDTKKSKTDFGAVALGLIPNNSSENFTSVSSNNPIFANDLTALSITGGSSGYFNSSTSAGSTRLFHCATDFYHKTQINTPSPAPSTDLNWVITNDCKPNHAGRCQYIWSGDITGPGDVIIPEGVQITLYVTSDIKISTNIKYDNSFDPNNRADIPYFALIDYGGNITLTNDATRLDGLYVAQPNSGAGGNFVTCDSRCPYQLIVNGAVIAQRVKLLRAHGTSQSLTAQTTNVGNTPAEIFNFVPSMVLGAPDFNPQPQAPTSQFSLPPVF